MAPTWGSAAALYFDEKQGLGAGTAALGLWGEQRGSWLQGPCLWTLVSDISRILRIPCLPRLAQLPSSPLGALYAHDLSGYPCSSAPASLPSGLLGPLPEPIPEAGGQDPPPRPRPCRPCSDRRSRHGSGVARVPCSLAWWAAGDPLERGALRAICAFFILLCFKVTFKKVTISLLHGRVHLLPNTG